MTIEAVVALKTLSQSKRRLSAVLNDEQRSDLVEAMAQDVLSCLMRHPQIEAVHVVCGEGWTRDCLLYTSPSPRDATLSRMPSSA